MRVARSVVVLVAALALGCQAQRQGARVQPSSVFATNPVVRNQVRDRGGVRALGIENGQPRWTDAARAARDGYTLIDLSDDFTPFLFVEHAGADGQLLASSYRRTF